MCRRLFLAWLFILGGCTTVGLGPDDSGAVSASRDIRYITGDYSNAFVFSDGEFRGGSILALRPGGWSASVIEAVRLGEGIECLSIGTRGNWIQYAVKRPIRADEEYRCRATTFHVTQCFDGCRAAIVRADIPLSGPNPSGSYSQFMYVDNCRGVLVFSLFDIAAEGIPLSAFLLRGARGILAAPDGEDCALF